MKKFSYWPNVWIQIICLAAVIYGDAYALGSSEKFIQPYVATDLVYDSNLLRVSDELNTVSVIGQTNKGSFIERVRAGFDLDWKLNRQHFLLKGEVNYNWYQNFDDLNYLGWDTLAQWTWELGNYSGGKIGYSNNQVLGDFTQINRLLPNLINIQRYFANAGYLFHPNGKVLLGWFRTDTEYDDNDREFSNNIEDNAEFELQYLSSTGSTFGVRILSTFGQYTDRIFTADSLFDDGYLRMNYWLIWKWLWSSKTQFDWQIGYTQQENDHLTSRDFSDVTGRLTVNWAMSDKTQLLLSSWREIDQADDEFASFILTQGAKFSPTWKMTHKVEISLPLSYERLEYLDNSTGISTDLEKQVDNIWSATLNVLYVPFDSTTLGIMLRYEKKNSNFVFKSYETASVGLNMQLAF